MVTLLAKIFIKDSEDKIKQREAYGMLCGVIGILFNVLLFIGKFLAGTLSIPLRSQQMPLTTFQMQVLRS